MKKLLLTILLISSPAFAFEDYMIISNEPVKSVRVQNPEILDVSLLFTIDNQKKNIIITPKKAGKTKITADFGNKSKKIDIKVTEEKTFINASEDFNVFLIDFPPKKYEIPEPPVFRRAK